ncbi:hypothetical protein P3S67_008510 [Capsicum chacoense]
MTDFEVEVKEVASAAEYTIQLRLTETVLGENKSQEKKGAPKVSSKPATSGRGRGSYLEIVYKGIAQNKGNFAEPSTINDQNGYTVKMKGEEELADMLHKSLKRKRYLIVLDDIWSCEVWDGMRRCFPTEDDVGSRILLTTCNNEVARGAGIENLSMQMNYMDQEESWKLFKSAAFSNEALSSEFETIGRKIAEICHGLPLTIVVVAGLLKSKRVIEDWESVAKDVTSFITNDPDEQYSRVLGLMRSWMAEGFLKLENDLEGEAEKCLQELVDRCLVLVCKKSPYGTKIRSRKVHDLIYDLCVREIQRENIFIMNDIVLDYSYSECRYLSMQKMQPFKRVTSDEIDFCPYGLYRALPTPVHRQEVIMRIQNVKEFGISGYRIHSNGLLNNLVHLQQLETLSLTYCLRPLVLASAKAIPATLKKVKLERTFLRSSYLDIIAELPNLEVLKVMDYACRGEEWHPNVRGFARLKILLIEDNDVKYWKATNDNFPVLERLMIRSCQNLKDIPIEFAEIHTLQLIELRKCSPKLGESAARIQKEQEDLGNNPANVHISDPWENSEEYFGRRIELLGFHFGSSVANYH